MQKLQINIALLIMLAVILVGRPESRAENWPQFRGPTGLGITGEKNLPITWSSESMAWKAPLIGQGHASPIVWGNRVFVCTAHWPESVRKREEVIPEHHVLYYQAVDGKLLWDTLVPPGPWLRTDFRSGPGGGYCGGATTSKAAPWMRRSSACRSGIRGSGATEMAQSIPLSATNMPYFFSPLRMAWTAGENCEMSKSPFRRSRSPMRG